MKPSKNYFVCNRSLFKNPMWYAEPFTKGQAWVDLFGNANHADGWFEKSGQRIYIKRGQTGRSIESLARDWKWSRNKVKRFLKRLEKEKMIDRVSDTNLNHLTNHLTTIITICNYDKYQFDLKNSEPPDEPPHEPPHEPQTIKGKEEVKKRATKAPEPDDFMISDSFMKWAKKKGMTEPQLKESIEACLIWHGAKGNEYKDWTKTIQNWIIKGKKFEKANTNSHSMVI
jgi:hypothetical protein